MDRRSFLLGATGLAGASAAAYWSEERISASAAYPGRREGHALRDTRDWPEASETLETEIFIAGSGVAGLTAAWRLSRAGVREILMASGPELHGNAAAGRSGDLAYPTGAHYLPLPSLESTHIRTMLAEFGLITQDPFGDDVTYDERALVHAPAERVLYRRSWQDGYLPTDGVAPTERAEHERFWARVETFIAARGRDGRRAFVVPIELSSTDAQFRELDTLTYQDWLTREGFVSPTLHWYLDYTCRDDYGRSYREISAWAGLHYFCARAGVARNVDRGAVLTWPEGLAALTRRLEEGARPALTQRAMTVARLSIDPNARYPIDALCFEAAGDGWRTVRVRARTAIAAMPLFVLAHVLAEPSAAGFDARRDLPVYSPWLVSNFLMRAFPEEQAGAPLSWDNVVYREPGLGYVVSTHQEFRVSRPDRTAFTAYTAFSEMDPLSARRWLDTATSSELLEVAARDLKLAYGWRFAPCVERVEMTVRAHAMAAPTPGFLGNPGRLALRHARGPLFFAHSDLSGMSLFEEASWWGWQAADAILATRGAPSGSPPAWHRA